MSNGIYKCTLHIRYLGQQIVNTLWYRSALEGNFLADLLIDGAQALGQSVINHIWNAAYAGRMPANAYLDGVSVMGFNDQFELLYNNTITVVPSADDANGTLAQSETWLPIGNCANLAFNMKNRLISMPWFKPPSKGLIAVSPVLEAWAGNDGTLNDDGTSYYETLANALAQKLPWDFATIDLPFTNWTPAVGLPNAFIPVRAKTWQFETPQELGGIMYLKHIETTDVESCHVRKLLGYRRSRRVEG
jgi:hypothetical protein